MKAYFLKLAEYNIWANNRAISWLKLIDEEQWEQKTTSSFASIRETAIHIASAEKIWVDFWTKVAAPVYLSAGFNGTKDELIEIWQKASKDIKTHLENYPEDELEHQVTFVYPRGGEGQMAFWQTFSHIINHSTYHRGQLVTLLRSSGFTDLTNTDLATYYLTM
ncbi:DinB family protein [Mucilaginibacter sp. UR6-1]|uniref:DinB family protein n=1 Tax=Mucilaginibacter sp. UR6-1 TaxID=1435643 RepID=UPI001E34C870|nr:DinB family protein [Mucilaginibacter sp. UR6-1]MCC8409152.1 DinB family protein [Mucilaginibacter sp. UR6-1]